MRLLLLGVIWANKNTLKLGDNTMKYSYDSHGWYVGPTTSESRSTNCSPTPTGVDRVVGQLWPNFTGTSWINVNYIEPIAPVVVPEEHTYLIDVGPFFDRFGVAKLLVLTHTDPIVKAVREDIQARHWIDLRRADVAGPVAYMAGMNVPGLGTISSPITALTPSLIAHILFTPVDDSENDVLRKLYFK